MLSLDDAADHLHGVRLPVQLGGPAGTRRRRRPGRSRRAARAPAPPRRARPARGTPCAAGSASSPARSASPPAWSARPRATSPCSPRPRSARCARPRRGGSTSMPHKRNPVAAVAALGCAQQAPGAGRDPAGRDGAGARARRRRLAQRMAAAVRPPDHHRLRGVPGCAPASRASRSTPSACWPTSATPATRAPPPSCRPSTGAPMIPHHVVTGRRAAARPLELARHHLDMWEDQVPALAEHFTLIRYDTRGHGGSRHAARPVHARRPRPGRDRPARPPRDRAARTSPGSRWAA